MIKLCWTQKRSHIIKLEISYLIIFFKWIWCSRHFSFLPINHTAFVNGLIDLHREVFRIRSMFKTQLNTQICRRTAQNYSVNVMEFTVSNISDLTNAKLMVNLLYFLESVVVLCDPCTELSLCRQQQKELTLSITNPQKQSSKTCVCIFSLTGTKVVYKTSVPTKNI
jgi:hypothetical protein